MLDRVQVQLDLDRDFEGERNEASALGLLCRLPGAIELLAVRLDRYVEGDRLKAEAPSARADVTDGVDSKVVQRICRRAAIATIVTE